MLTIRAVLATTCLIAAMVCASRPAGANTVILLSPTYQPMQDATARTLLQQQLLQQQLSQSLRRTLDLQQQRLDVQRLLGDQRLRRQIDDVDARLQRGLLEQRLQVLEMQARSAAGSQGP
ncbi:MAG TPA: hypothetical protein VNJ51_04640 [Candidatus Dormibacteraeota bacterium]|nr:hypothetical protein [Candidatus Dormibacteraeota bacterium]